MLVILTYLTDPREVLISCGGFFPFCQSDYDCVTVSVYIILIMYVHNYLHFYVYVDFFNNGRVVGT